MPSVNEYREKNGSDAGHRTAGGPQGSFWILNLPIYLCWTAPRLINAVLALIYVKPTAHWSGNQLAYVIKAICHWASSLSASSTNGLSVRETNRPWDQSPIRPATNKTNRQ